ncbi:MAG: response regulator transcription factor [Bacteroidia bacterium]|nr:response regulator transcription factor [Bacteroidia bacterium]
MKNVIIIEDDENLASLIKDHVNQIEGISCELIFNNPVDYLNELVEADIILLDIMMPEMNGLDAIEKILDIHPNVSIVINSIKDDTDTIFKAIQSGAVGYIDKQSFVMNFHEVFSSIDNQGAYMTPKIARKVFSFFQKSSNVYEMLSARETEVVQGILDGLSYKLIADRYEISLDTVRFHIKTIYRKLKINSKSQLFNIFKFKP